MRRLTLVLVAVCTLALTGCLSAPAPQQDELAIEYQVNNEATSDYEVSLVVAPDPFDGVRVTFANGTRRTYDVGRIDQLPPQVLGQATDLEPLGEPIQTRTLTVDARTGFGGRLENVSQDTVVLYTVRRAGEGVAFRGWGGVRCPPSEGHLRVELTINADESFNAGVTCIGS